MTPDRLVSPWRGRIIALVGIVLVAANLRTAVTALSPIYALIGHDFALSSVAIGVLGTLPPVCFAVFGIIAPIFTRRLTLETVLIIAIGCIVAGNLVRAASSSYVVLLAGSALAFAGMGTGNVLLPPLVKRYFPHAIGRVTSIYATVMAITTLLPPLVAYPVADAFGWRVSTGMWAILAVSAVLPWIGLGVRQARAQRAHGSASRVNARSADAATNPVHAGDPRDHVEEADGAVVGRLWRIPLAWALGVTFAISSLVAYAMFAWLPNIVHDVAGASPEVAGALLSLDAAMGLPAAILIPWLAGRVNVATLVWVAMGFFLCGFAGLIFVPTVLTWLWVCLLGLGPMTFPLCLFLINARTRTHSGSVALSGFIQGPGYTIGAIGPLVIGLLHQLTGTWTIALVVLAATCLAYIFTGRILARPQYLEDFLRPPPTGRGGSSGGAGGGQPQPNPLDHDGAPVAPAPS